MHRRRFRALLTAGLLAISVASTGPAIAAKGGNGGGGGTEVIDFKGKLPIAVPFVNPCVLPNIGDILMFVHGDVQYAVNLTLGRGGRLADLRLHLNFGDLDAQPVLGGILGTRHYTVNGTLNTNQKISFTKGSGKLEPITGHFFVLGAGPGGDMKISFIMKGNVQGNGELTDVIWDFGPGNQTISIPGFGTLVIRHAECGVFDL
jgi:hypothetical protein